MFKCWTTWNVVVVLKTLPHGRQFKTSPLIARTVSPNLETYPRRTVDFEAFCLGILTPWRFADSGCTQHITDQRWVFNSFQPIRPGTWSVSGIGIDNKPLQVHGYGSVPVTCEVKEGNRTGILKHVLFVPKLGANLFSVRSAIKRVWSLFLGNFCRNNQRKQDFCCRLFRNK